MKKILEEIRGARGIEWFLVILAISVLLLTQWNDQSAPPVMKTEQEQRIAAILSRIEGAGEVEVMISDQNTGGILVVAEGADELMVCLRIQYAVQTLMDMDVSRIEIVPYRK